MVKHILIQHLNGREMDKENRLLTVSQSPYRTPDDISFQLILSKSFQKLRESNHYYYYLISSYCFL